MRAGCGATARSSSRAATRLTRSSMSRDKRISRSLATKFIADEERGERAPGESHARLARRGHLAPQGRHTPASTSTRLQTTANDQHHTSDTREHQTMTETTYRVSHEANVNTDGNFSENDLVLARATAAIWEAAHLWGGEHREGYKWSGGIRYFAKCSMLELIDQFTNPDELDITETTLPS